MADAAKSTGERTVYFDGRLCSPDAARLSIEDHGALYGLGFFETFRTSGGWPHLWDWHSRRLLRACAFAGITLPPSFLANSESRLHEAVQVLLDAHRLEDGVFRYTVTAGRPSQTDGYPSYDRPGEWLSARPLPRAPGAEGVTLRVLATRRDNGEWLPRPKSLSFANALLGGRELQRRSATSNDEGLFLARDGGAVVETVRQNVAWLAGGRWAYPDPALGAVAGTCLEWLLDQGFAAQPVRASLEEFARAEAVVVLNSVRGITPVRELWDSKDHAVLGSWHADAHLQVIRLRGWWSEALRETADGGPGATR